MKEFKDKVALVTGVGDGINPFIILVLNAIHGDKFISVHHLCSNNTYDDAMKKSLREIA